MKRFVIPALVTALIIGGGFAVPRAGRAQSNVSINPPSAPVAVQKADLRLTVTFDQSTVTPPATVQLTFIVTNTGPVTAKRVGLANTLPVEFQYASATAATLENLGDLATGESITKSLAVNIPAEAKSNRYVDEAIASAANADSVETDLVIDVANGQVLGVSDQLAETGQEPWMIVLIGLGTIALGVFLFRFAKSAS